MGRAQKYVCSLYYSPSTVERRKNISCNDRQQLLWDPLGLVAEDRPPALATALGKFTKALRQAPTSCAPKVHSPTADLSHTLE